SQRSLHLDLDDGLGRRAARLTVREGDDVVRSHTRAHLEGGTLTAGHELFRIEGEADVLERPATLDVSTAGGEILHHRSARGEGQPALARTILPTLAAASDRTALAARSPFTPLALDALTTEERKDQRENAHQYDAPMLH